MCTASFDKTSVLLMILDDNQTEVNWTYFASVE